MRSNIQSIFIDWSPAKDASSLVGNVVRKPVKPLIQTLTRGSTCALDVPVPLAQGVQAKLVGDFSSIHGIRKILFVCKYQKHSITELVLVQHTMELISGLNNTLSVVAVHNKNEALGVLEVVPPQGSDLLK